MSRQREPLAVRNRQSFNPDGPQGGQRREEPYISFWEPSTAGLTEFP